MFISCYHTERGEEKEERLKGMIELRLLMSSVRSWTEHKKQLLVTIQFVQWLF